MAQVATLAQPARIVPTCPLWLMIWNTTSHPRQLDPDSVQAHNACHIEVV